MPVDEIAKAMRKLTRESVSVKYLKAPYQLAHTRSEIERFKNAKDIKVESRMMAFFHRRSTADIPLDIQLQALQIREKELANDFIDAELTPLTEAETWEVKCEWGAIRNTLLEKELQYEGAAREAYHLEVEKASSGIWIGKWIGIALKKKEKVDGKWVRWGTIEDLAKVEQSTLDWLFNFYHESFSLTDDELGKSVASMTQAS